MLDLVHALSPLIPLFLLVSIRVGVVFASLPAPFGEIAPTQVRAALSIMIAIALCLPNAAELSQPFRDFNAVQLGIAAIGEAMVGGVIGLTVRVTLAAAEMAGSLVGTSSGLGFATSVDPMFGEVSLPTTHVLGAIGVLIFLIMQGHHVLIQGMAGSLTLAPPGNAWAAILNSGALHVGSGMVARALQIASPVVASMFIVQVGTALVTRAAPRVHLFALTFAFSIAAGLVILFVAAPSIMYAIDAEVRRLPEALHIALGGSR